MRLRPISAALLLGAPLLAPAPLAAQGGTPPATPTVAAVSTDPRLAKLKAEGVSVSGDLTRTATIASGQSAILSWPARVQDEGMATLTFTATGTGGLSDSLIQELPVYIAMTPETMATGGVVTIEYETELYFGTP